MRRSHWLFAIGLAVLAGCSDDAIAPTTPEDARAMLALAPEFTLDRLTSELGLQPEQSEAFERRLNELHNALKDVHRLLPAEGEDASAADAADPAFEVAMERVHEKHDALLQGLTEEQRERFIHHAHERLQAHLREGGHDRPAHGMPESLRGLAERLHGARGH